MHWSNVELCGYHWKGAFIADAADEELVLKVSNWLGKGKRWKLQLVSNIKLQISLLLLADSSKQATVLNLAESEKFQLIKIENKNPKNPNMK